MPFILKKYSVCKGTKIQIALLKDLQLTPKFSQRMLIRKRVFDANNIPYSISEDIRDDYIYIAQFQGHTRGLKPLLTFEEFALFDKPSNLMIHPSSKHTAYSLLDEIRYHFGEKANQIHRIDAETSGLLLIGRNETAINELGTMFEEKKYKKSYLALVEGKIAKEITIDKKIEKENQKIGVKMQAGFEGKESVTIIKPIEYHEKNHLSLVEAIPITGRQHQIRVHLYSIGHRIIGDPIYGVSDDVAEDYLNKNLTKEDRIKFTGSHRLWLHANYLEFEYKKAIYKLYSRNKDIKKEFKKHKDKCAF